VNLMKHEKTNHLSESSFSEISEHLSRLAEKLNISAVILVNSAGQILAHHTGPMWKADTLSISVLSASTYSAANEMAKLISEESNFLMVLHEGKRQSILTSAVSKDYFLVVVFPKETALGLVRLFTKKTTENLQTLVKKPEQPVRKEQAELGEHFQALLSKELDRAFGDF